MITKEEYMLMTDDEAIKYVSDNFFSEDVNDVCEEYVLESCDYDEEEVEEILEDYQPFGYVVESMSGDELKDYLYENIVKQCEELDLNEEDED